MSATGGAIAISGSSRRSAPQTGSTDWMRASASASTSA
jgi:hypothetical protein